MLLNRHCSSAAMAHFLRIKLNINRELDSHLFPLLDELRDARTPLQRARREMFFLKACAGVLAVQASGKRLSVKARLLPALEKTMRVAHRTCFPSSDEDYAEALDEFQQRYRLAGLRDTGATPYEHIGVTLDAALTGGAGSDNVRRLGRALFHYKLETCRRYLDAKWVLR